MHSDDISEPTWCYGTTLAWNAKDAGSIPALGTIFPFFITQIRVIYVGSDLDAKNSSPKGDKTPIQKSSLQCQWQIQRSWFGKELPINMHIYTHINIYEKIFVKKTIYELGIGITSPWWFLLGMLFIGFWKRVLRVPFSFANLIFILILKYATLRWGT